MRLTAAAVVAGVMAAGVLIPAPVYSHKPITTNILFKNEIAQIFQRKCFQCHSDNNLGMSLTSYTEARPWARAIREEVLERKMPPWQAVPGYGHFTNDLSLNAREKEIILSWADGGAPSGVLKAEESVPPVYVPAVPAWDHGQPDRVVPIGTGHAIVSGAEFAIERFVVDTNFPAATRVRAIALKQGDRRVVRHAAFYDEATGDWIGGWTPWQTISQFAANTSVRLPAQARVGVEIGYSGADQDVIDKSELGFYLDATDSATVAGTMTLAAPATPVGAGARDVRVRAEARLATDTKVLGFWPDPGEGVRSLEIAAVTPDGMSSPLLWITDFRPEWRSPYLMSAVLDLPRGSRLVLTSYFDNPGDQPLTARPKIAVVTAVPSRRVAAPRK